MDDPNIEREIWPALGRIEDPCMCLAGRGLSIVDMGIVTGVQSVEGFVTVSLLFTDPSCLFELRITQAIESRLAAIKGVNGVRIDIGCGTVWTPDRLSRRAKASFAADRSRLQTMTAVPRERAEPRVRTPSDPERGDVSEGEIGKAPIQRSRT